MKILAPWMVAPCVMLLGGCATNLSPSECATANWHELGRDDGAHGRRERIADYHEACGKAHIAVDAEAYRRGRADGLPQYCRLDNAINQGLAGETYDGVCPGPRDQAFRQHRDAGYAVHAAKYHLSQLRYEQERLQKELRDPKANDGRKRDLRSQLDTLDRKLEYGRDELSRAQNRLDRLQADLRASGAY